MIVGCPAGIQLVIWGSSSYHFVLCAHLLGEKKIRTGILCVVPCVVALFSGLVLGSLWVFACALDPLLAKPDQFHLVPLLGQNRMALGLMLRGSFRLVVPGKVSPRYVTLISFSASDQSLPSWLRLCH